MWIPRSDLWIVKASALFVICAFAVSAYTFRPAAAQRAVDFNREIRPILADKCFACHGPDAVNKKIKLRLDSESAATADLGGGRRAVVAGQPEKSEMVRRITADDEFERMPPTHSGRQLTKPEIELLTLWIKQGAKWQGHWAFLPPKRPEFPTVKQEAWIRNPIDRFVLARLEREGLTPSPEADRATLLRRVSLDLTGLPPTPAELDAFLADPSPNAYEKVIDRLLASPRYGERMASRWLDAARYADTNGYQIDGERSMWRYRDWVIAAFNRNMPFDQFMIEQLAGDLLPSPTLDQKIATAFNRNHRGNSEDGIVPEEYAVEYVVDRVDTTSTVFLGLTMGCARCHNHKFDPIQQREYYQLFAYFNSIPEDGRANNFGNSAPWVVAPTREQQAELKRIDRRIAMTERSLAASARLHLPAERRWERALKPGNHTQWFPGDNLVVYHPLTENAAPVINKIERIDFAKPEEKIETKPPLMPYKVGFKNGEPQYVEAPTGQGVAFDGRIYYDAGRTADFNFRDRLKDYKDQFALSIWFYAESDQSGALITHMQDALSEKEGNLPKNRGYGLFLIDGKLHFNVVGVWADDSYRIETADRVSLKQWHHVLAVCDSTEQYEKSWIYLDGKRVPLKVNNSRLFRTFGDTTASLRIGGGAGPDYRFKGKLSEARVYQGRPDDDQIAILACPESLEQIAAIPPVKRTQGQRLKLRRAFWEAAAPPALRAHWNQNQKLKAERLRLEAVLPTVMVMEESPEARPAFLLRRGAYDLKGESVVRGVPGALHPLAAGLPNNRLGLARWLASPENPLTSRVTVNRFWQMLFGTGIVKTAEDFGVQDEQPSHPELLDWLALEFQRPATPQSKAWDVKALLKTIVMSASYRQASLESPSLLQRDPENRLLARGPRMRLSAEIIRDQALFDSGLLVEKFGGPSVRPYQPAGLFKDMVFSNMTRYEQSEGDGLWRRSLYTFWKRTIMPPSMQVFDASAREACTVREVRTNTPLQALNLMNDVTYLEAARMLAVRMMREGGARPEERIAWAFRVLTARPPDEGERRILTEHVRSELARFAKQPETAAQFLTVGEKRIDGKIDPVELAAYAATASLMLNLDEVITKQ